MWFFEPVFLPNGSARYPGVCNSLATVVVHCRTFAVNEFYISLFIPFSDYLGQDASRWRFVFLTVAPWV